MLANDIGAFAASALVRRRQMVGPLKNLTRCRGHDVGCYLSSVQYLECLSGFYLGLDLCPVRLKVMNGDCLHAHLSIIVRT